MLKLCGIETEYAFGVEGQQDVQVQQVDLFGVLTAFLCQACGWTSAPVNSFLPNGGRLYQDLQNAEWATPECRSLYDLVQYDQAGEFMFSELHGLELKRLLPRTDSDAKIFVFKTNVAEAWLGDPHKLRKTAGCHENYLVPASTRYFPDRDQFFLVLCKALIPFLVTRQLLCGAGKIGYDGSLPSINYGYQISQRSDYIDCLSSFNTTGQRPIINLRDEPHADPKRFRRIHLILGDANLSPWATFLKAGTTLFVINMVIDNFLTLALELEDPVAAIKLVSHDVTCKKPLALKRGQVMSPVDIQRAYLQQAKEYLSGQASPEDQLVVKIWEEVLDRLDGFESSKNWLFRRLDWVKKYLILNSYHQQKELRWEDPSMNIANLKYHIPRPRSGSHISGSEMYEFERFPWPEPLPPACDPLRAPPADTRALLRGLAVASGRLAGAEWNELTFSGGSNRFSLPDPLEFNRPDIYNLLDPSTIVKHLHRALHSPDKAAQASAVAALQTLGDRSLKPELIRMAMGPDLEIRMLAREALDRMTQETE